MAMGAVGGALAWFGRDFLPGIFGSRRRRQRSIEQENDVLRASLSQAVAAIELLLVAVELPEDKRHSHISRARALAEDAKAILGVGRPLAEGME